MSATDDEFFEAYVRCFGPLKAVRTDRTPLAMILGVDAESEGWIEWRLMQDGPELARALAELEHASGIRLPTSLQ